MNGLTIENLRFRAMGPLSLSVPGGQCVGITGPSGAGKTLFLRAVADMDPHTGRIFLNGIESAQMPGPKWRKKVGLLPAESSWWSDTVGEHFCSPDQKRDLDAQDSEMRSRFVSLGFDMDVLKWQVTRLSSGERQRLALVRLLGNHPEALLLDEPTANLDPENTARVETLLGTYQHGNQVPVIWISHDIEQLSRMSDRRFFLKNGLFPS